MAFFSSTARMPALSATTRGSIAMFAGMFLFTINDTLVKLTVEHLPTSQVMVLRGIFSIVIVGALVITICGFRSLTALMDKPVMARSVFETITALCYITALAHMGLAEMLSLMQTTPLMLTALSLPVLGIAVGWRNWMAVVVGFVGVLAIVQPTPAGFNSMALVALGAAFAVTLRDLTTRRIHTGIHSLVITLSASVFVFAVGLVLALFETWVMPTLTEWLYLLAAAVMLSVGNLCVILAFRGTDIAIVGSFRYTVVLWSIILSALVWNVLPNTLALAGAALIVLSGVYTLFNAAVTRRKALQAQMTSQIQQSRDC